MTISTTSGETGIGTIVSRIVAAVPEFRTRYLDLAARGGDHLSPGAVLAELGAFVGEATARVPFPHDLLGRCLDLVEDLLARSDAVLAAEIGASFLGNLPITTITAGLLWMGPATLTALESLEEEIVD